MTFISEVGKGVFKIKTAKQFVSWLTLGPNNKITKLIGRQIPKIKNKLASALRNTISTIDYLKSRKMTTCFKRIVHKK